ncbi:MAG: plasmid stabilization protein [Ignavibacteria bacterium GWB2_35_12]|nr:MAG: plasmid stabilization protein [Ignavibacteria bacterium GWA2_35_8]OGU38042.1 MAG: plasmid stabilization protein [Ignavibacteria bacterium GWB2_35_12]OGU87490.1 MAG: plasmid stabilization protein [Ignavibacteria bacterium RIFOXYA2_FULL_35_10]OGV25036.1 MAG: plasmid stabilization protein [Ignavibacteria bacterium RIFOXYC2_FULL_35_21]
MKIKFESSFQRDVKKIQDKKLSTQIKNVISLVKEVQSVQDIPNFRKITGSRYYYRIRVGNYRIGCKYQNNEFTFIRFLHRKDIYHYFPES